MDRETTRRMSRYFNSQMDRKPVRRASGDTHMTAKASDKLIGEWMDGELSEGCGNDGSTDVCGRRQINTPNER